MITTDNIKLKKIAELNSSYVESELAKLGILPLRWAIVEVLDEYFVLSVSYRK